MKKVTVIFYQSGQNAGTRSPLCFVESFTGNLNEKVSVCRSFDDDGLVDVNMYEIAEIEMPIWMDEATYLTNHIALRFAVDLGFKMEWSEISFFNYIKLNDEYKFFISWLLTKYKNTKNGFMLSIKEQVQNWLETPQNKHPQPLSHKQFNAASNWCPLYQAKQITTKTYYSF